MENVKRIDKEQATAIARNISDRIRHAIVGGDKDVAAMVIMFAETIEAPLGALPMAGMRELNGQYAPHVADFVLKILANSNKLMAVAEIVMCKAAKFPAKSQEEASAVIKQIRETAEAGGDPTATAIEAVLIRIRSGELEWDWVFAVDFEKRTLIEFGNGDETPMEPGMPIPDEIRAAAERGEKVTVH